MMRVRPPSGSRQVTSNSTVPKFRYQWSRVPFPPSAPDFSKDFFAILLHFRDQSTGCCRLLVPRPPNEQFQKYRCQINPFLRQPVVHPSSIRLLRLRGDDPRRFELPQTVRQDVRGNPFARFPELLKCPEPANHQIADNQQRPAISKHLEGDTHRAAGPGFRLGLPRHIRHIINITCKIQAILQNGSYRAIGHVDFARAVPREPRRRSGFRRRIGVHPD